MFGPGLPLAPCRCSWDCGIIWFRVYSCFTSPIGFLFVVAAEIIIFRRTFFTAGGSGGLLAFICRPLSKRLPARPRRLPRAVGGPVPYPVDGGVLGWLGRGGGHCRSGLCGKLQHLSRTLPHPLWGGYGAVRPLGMSEPSVSMFSKWCFNPKPKCINYPPAEGSVLAACVSSPSLRASCSAGRPACTFTSPRLLVSLCFALSDGLPSLFPSLNHQGTCGCQPEGSGDGWRNSIPEARCCLPCSPRCSSSSALCYPRFPGCLWQQFEELLASCLSALQKGLALVGRVRAPCAW